MFKFWQKQQRKEDTRQRKLDAARLLMQAAAESTTLVADRFAEWLRQEDISDAEVALLLCDLDGVIVRCNDGAKSMFGTDLTNRPISDFVWSDEPFAVFWQSVLSDRSAADRLMTGSRTTGEIVPLIGIMTRLERRDEPSRMLVLLRARVPPEQWDERLLRHRGMVHNVRLIIERIKKCVD